MPLSSNNITFTTTETQPSIWKRMVVTNAPHGATSAVIKKTRNLPDQGIREAETTYYNAAGGVVEECTVIESIV
ncbi:hypothetical protein BDV12DRAFT_171890, partial [Aspergillus spectabilis]